MDWFGPSCKVETVEEHTVLCFQVTEQRRKIDYLIPVALMVAGGVAMGFGSLVMVLSLGVLVAVFAYRLIGIATYSLEVTDTKLSSTGRSGQVWRKFEHLQVD